MGNMQDGSGKIVIRPPLAGRIGSAFGTVLLGAGGLAMLGGAAIFTATGEIALVITLAVCSAVIIGLFFYVLRDTRSKLKWRVTIGADALELDLPGGRSAFHRLDPVHTKVRYDEIAAVETRLEAYPSMGMVNINRAYALRLKAGDLIILGEDRGLNTALASATLTTAVGQMLEHGGLKARDRGMALGRGGFLCVLYTSPPPWDARNLSDKQQAELWRKAGMTGQIAQSAAFVTLFNSRN